MKFVDTMIVLVMTLTIYYVGENGPTVCVSNLQKKCKLYTTSSIPAVTMQTTIEDLNKI